MKSRKRIYYTDTQKALMWHRWQQSESLNQIARPVRSAPQLCAEHPGRARWHSFTGEVKVSKGVELG